MAEVILDDIPQDEIIALLGARDENLRMLREALGVKVMARNGMVCLQGSLEQVELGAKILEQMRAKYRSEGLLSVADIRLYLDQSLSGKGEEGAALAELAGPMRKLRARSAGQSGYIEAIRTHDLTLCIGPAGTGKTYLAVAAALEALRARTMKRIVLVRPAVEAGEKLGFLPGDTQAKVHPFLRPLLDALHDMLDFHQVRSYMERDVVEVIPLAFMRGRSLNDSFIILDEGQNITVPQMQMFLTRMGMGSKIVVNGDVTQVDLPPGTPNGLEDAVRRLRSLPQVAVVRMGRSDIVRHPLVQAIVEAYESNGPRADVGPPTGDGTL